MKNIYLKRLEDLRDTVKNVPAKLLDIEVYKAEKDCGTVVCALGAYSTMFPTRRAARSGYDHFGFTSDTGHHVFLAYTYPPDATKGSAGKKECLRRINKAIANRKENLTKVLL